MRFGGRAALPESPPLRHLLVQVPLLALLPRHALIVGRQAEDGPRPLVCGRHGARQAQTRH